MGVAKYLRQARQWPEWWVILVTLGFAAYYGLTHSLEVLPLDDMFYYQLSSYFASFVVLLASLAFAADALRSLERKDRTVAIAAFVLLCGAGVSWLVQTYNPPHSYWFGRLVEAAALTSVIAITLVVLYLHSSGALSWQRFSGVTARFIALWGPLGLYLVAGGFCLTWMMQSLSTLWDPVLMRMDLSFGGIPARSAFLFGYGSDWMESINDFGYPMLGLTIALPAFCLYASANYAQARRCLMGLVLVACLGLASYTLVPAVGPLYAYKPILAAKAIPQNDIPLDNATIAIMEGPETIEGYHDQTRNVFPSLHTAFSLMALTAAWFWRRWLFWLCLPLGIIQILTAVTTGYHYVVDIIAAFPFTALCWWLANVLMPAKGGAGYVFAITHQRASLVKKVFGGSLLLSGLLLWIWAGLAPISPIPAWGFTLIIMVPPCVASLLLTHHLEPGSAASAQAQAS